MPSIHGVSTGAPQESTTTGRSLMALAWAMTSSRPHAVTVHALGLERVGQSCEDDGGVAARREPLGLPERLLVGRARLGVVAGRELDVEPLRAGAVPRVVELDRADLR